MNHQSSHQSSHKQAHHPELTLELVDPEEGVRGYIVIDRLVRGAAAGGLRIAPGVTRAEVEALARNMTLKQAAAGIEVGGAKGGIDMRPDAPYRREVLHRFLRRLRPLVLDYLSLGPDMNTSLRELEEVGRTLDIPCLKIAVGRSRGLSDDVFLRRYALLEAATPLGTVNELRPCMAVAEAARAALEVLGRSGPSRIAIQGAGTMGGGTARLLAADGHRIVAWSDDRRCVQATDGLDVHSLLEGRRAGRLPELGHTGQGPSAALLEVECDVLVLAAISNAITPQQAATARCRAVVEAANLAISHDVEELLHQRGIVVVPDLLASVGGSLAVEALHAAEPTQGADILQHVRRRSGVLVRELLDASARTGRSPRALLHERQAGA